MANKNDFKSNTTGVNFKESENAKSNTLCTKDTIKQRNSLESDKS